MRFNPFICVFSDQLHCQVLPSISSYFHFNIVCCAVYPCIIHITLQRVENFPPHFTHLLHSIINKSSELLSTLFKASNACQFCYPKVSSHFRSPKNISESCHETFLEHSYRKLFCLSGASLVLHWLSYTNTLLLFNPATRTWFSWHSDIHWTPHTQSIYWNSHEVWLMVNWKNLSLRLERSFRIEASSRPHCECGPENAKKTSIHEHVYFTKTAHTYCLFVWHSFSKAGRYVISIFVQHVSVKKALTRMPLRHALKLFWF